MTTREKIVDLFLQNPDFTLKKIAKIVGTSYRTAKRAIANHRINFSNTKAPKIATRKGPNDPKLEKKVVAMIERHRNASTHDLARKCQTSASMIQRVKRRNGFKTYTKQNRALKTSKQFNEGIDRAKNLTRLLSNNKNSCLILDDETYVKMDFSQLPRKEFYIKKQGETLPEAMTNFGSVKFPPKRMVWQCICECGDRNQSFFINGTMNSETYIRECLQKRLLPFIRKHNVSCIFWPDLAPIHYSRASLDWFESNNIQIVPKTANPAAVPEDRPIERYWALCKRELKKEPKAAKDDKEFQYRWKRASGRVTKGTIQLMMSTVRQKIKSRAQLQKIDPET